jgi:hypothetical protein
MTTTRNVSFLNAFNTMGEAEELLKKLADPGVVVQLWNPAQTLFTVFTQSALDGLQEELNQAKKENAMINTNQPESAFPSTFKSMSPEEGQVHRWGMTLRDYFAAKAIQAILPAYENVFEDETGGDDDPTFPELLAKDAYIMADAMLKAREA